MTAYIPDYTPGSKAYMVCLGTCTRLSCVARESRVRNTLGAKMIARELAFIRLDDSCCATLQAHSTGVSLARTGSTQTSTHPIVLILLRHSTSTQHRRLIGQNRATQTIRFISSCCATLQAHTTGVSLARNGSTQAKN